jgi:ABC-type Fe3+/spermidine/putrescine transport system ATPase subunit
VPTEALHVREVFLDELMPRLRATGAAALYATHDAEEALGVADRVALLAAGRVVQVGTPEEVYHRPVDLWAARLTGPVSLLETRGGPVLVRPEWVRLEEGEDTATVVDVRFRGPHSEYLLETEGGRLLVREPGSPRHAPGDRVEWWLCESWPAQPSSREAGPA